MICFLRNDCAIIYDFFVQKLGNQSLVNMFANITDDISKKSIVTQICTSESELRVTATVAIGMGINCPDVVTMGKKLVGVGRMAAKAQAKLFYSNKEFGICLSKFIKKKFKYQSEISVKLQKTTCTP